MVQFMLIRLRFLGRNDMAWVAVDKSGIEGIYDNMPERNNDNNNERKRVAISQQANMQCIICRSKTITK